MTTTSSDLDVRVIPSPQKHPTIFGRWSALAPGESFMLINDHDPKPLYYQFEAEHKDQYRWEYDQQGPRDWIVRITKV